MFGASTDLGRRTAKRLLDIGHEVRLIARDISTLDHRADRRSGDIVSVAPSIRTNDTVISCAHARHTGYLLEALNSNNPRLILMGSAWRYSQVAEQRGEAVKLAEDAFLRSGRDGVMLHSTMIYGGKQENNISRLLRAIHRSPILPIPGCGENLVQPIYIDDVAQSLVGAAAHRWAGPFAMPISGPAPMKWRDMVASCVAALGHRRFMLPVPLSPVIAALKIARAVHLPAPDPNILLRFREDVSFPTTDMRSLLGVTSRVFDVGIRQMVAGH